MSCQHEWVRISKNYRNYVCNKCDMDMSVGEYEALQQARREGWEQGKGEAQDIVRNYEYDPDRDGDFADQLDEEIAAMKYKGESK